MKARDTAPKPRNPLVAIARFKRAGAHRGRRAVDRRAASAALRKEVDSLKEGP